MGFAPTFCNSYYVDHGLALPAFSGVISILLSDDEYFLLKDAGVKKTRRLDY